MARTLRIVEYDAAWPSRYAAEAARLRGALSGLATAIEHVGSTAVPGLAGKPVLDVAVAVASDVAAEACIVPMERLGYTYRGANGADPKRRYFVLNVAGSRMVQVHLYVLPAAAWDAKLAFRDALRADAELAAAYAAEKYRVAEEVGWDKTEYSLTKAAFVERSLASLQTGPPSATDRSGLTALGD